MICLPSSSSRPLQTDVSLEAERNTSPEPGGGRASPRAARRVRSCGWRRDQPIPARAGRSRATAAAGRGRGDPGPGPAAQHNAPQRREPRAPPPQLCAASPAARPRPSARPPPSRPLPLTVAELEQRRRVVQAAVAREAVLHAEAAGQRPLPRPGRAAAAHPHTEPPEPRPALGSGAGPAVAAAAGHHGNPGPAAAAAGATARSARQGAPAAGRGRAGSGAGPGAGSRAGRSLPCPQSLGRERCPAGGDAAGAQGPDPPPPPPGGRGDKGDAGGGGEPHHGLRTLAWPGQPSCGRRSPRCPEALSPRPLVAPGPNMGNLRAQFSCLSTSGQRRFWPRRARRAPPPPRSPAAAGPCLQGEGARGS